MGFAWQSSEAQGSELSGNLFVPIDRAHKLAKQTEQMSDTPVVFSRLND